MHVTQLSNLFNQQPDVLENEDAKEQLFARAQKILDKFVPVVQINLLNKLLGTLQHMKIWADQTHQVPYVMQQEFATKNILIQEFLEKSLMAKPNIQKQLVQLLVANESAFSQNPLILWYAKLAVDPQQSAEQKKYYNEILKTVIKNSPQPSVYEALYYLLFELATSNLAADQEIIIQALGALEKIAQQVQDPELLQRLIKILQQWFILDSLEFTLADETWEGILNQEIIDRAIKTLEQYANQPK